MNRLLVVVAVLAVVLCSALREVRSTPQGINWGNANTEPGNPGTITDFSKALDLMRQAGELQEQENRRRNEEDQNRRDRDRVYEEQQTVERTGKKTNGIIIAVVIMSIALVMIVGILVYRNSRQHGNPIQHNYAAAPGNFQDQGAPTTYARPAVAAGPRIQSGFLPIGDNGSWSSTQPAGRYPATTPSVQNNARSPSPRLQSAHNPTYPVPNAPPPHDLGAEFSEPPPKYDTVLESSIPQKTGKHIPGPTWE